ncbi:acyltransferase [Baekduia sp. Peel2402]|uniref:acyltransferase n=1 Tax=Baekduia sp. Peel2402 TaxID=3458296 RepID=UPI00403EBB3B
MSSSSPSDAALAPPSALPRRAGWRDRRRARKRGVVAGRDVAVGRGVRFDVAEGGRVELGDGVVLGDGCRFHVGPGATVVVGAGSWLGERCVITAQQSVSIGARCVFGDEVVLVDTSPVAGDVERPVRAQGLRAVPVVVGDGVRIGPSAALMAGTSIPDGATVDARATVDPAFTPDPAPRPPARPARGGRAPR